MLSFLIVIDKRIVTFKQNNKKVNFIEENFN